MRQRYIPGIMFLLCLMFAVGSVQAQGTFYVASDGNDSTGDGTLGNPWATITLGEYGGKRS